MKKFIPVVFTCALVLLTLSRAVIAIPSTVPATGQSACWDTTGHLANCINSGQDGETRSGVPLPENRFKDNRDSTVTDLLTGLTWMKSADIANAPMTWQQALDLVDDLNQHPDQYGRGGYFFNFRDWRLPNRSELKSLFEYRSSQPSLSETHPFQNLESWYWSATSQTKDPEYAWGVSLTDGSISVSGKGGQHYVWPVKGGNAGITPGPVISLAPESRNFGYVNIGQNRETGIKVFNIGDAPLTMGTLGLEGPHVASFLLSEDTCSGQTVQAGGRCTLQAKFSPGSQTMETANLTIPCNDLSVPTAVIPLSGQGGDPVIPAPTPATGQTTCHDPAGDMMTCPGTGQDGDFLKGAPFPSPRFTDNEDGSVTDHLTGLVWLKHTACTDPATWQQALDFVESLNRSPELHGCGGYSKKWRDWRLPSRRELSSLVDRSRHTPALLAGHPFMGLDPMDFWTSTNATGNGFNAWRVSLADGSISTTGKGAKLGIWPVRVGNSEIIDGPNLVLLPPEMNYHSVNMGDRSLVQTFELRNTGIQDLSINSITKTGDDPAMFTILEDPCSSKTLPPYEFCEIKVAFSPSSEGDKSAAIEFSTNDWNSPEKYLPLKGTTYAFINPSSVWKTGQTECSDASGNPAACAGSGQDGEIAYGASWPEPRFKDNLDGTVTDFLTGLMWLKSVNLPGRALNWEQALELARDLNQTPDTYGRGGYISSFRDWRLPNRKELTSLIDLSRNSPALSPDHLFIHVANGSYWTATTVPNQDESDNSWTVSLADGSISSQGKYSEHFFLAVRLGRQAEPPVPMIHATPESGRFPVTQQGVKSSPQTIAITNQGHADLMITDTMILGRHAPVFSITTDSCRGKTLQPRATCQLDLVYSPAAPGVSAAELQIHSNDPVAPVQTIPLTGTTQAESPLSPVITTGYQTCFDQNGNSAPCENSGQDGETRAGKPWPDPRFTDNGNGTITDGLTGLTWLKSGSCSPKIPWYRALETVRVLNQTPSEFGCGSYTDTFTDWRLPNARALKSLISYTRHSPALPESHPFVGIVNNHYWSSNTDPVDRFKAWTVSLADGSSGGSSKTSEHYFLAVRGGWIDPRKPSLDAEPGSHDFGLMPLGRTSAPQRFRIINNGRADLAFGSISLTGAHTGMFAITRSTCTALSPGTECWFDVTYKPASQGLKAAEIHIVSNDPGQPLVKIMIQGDTEPLPGDQTVIRSGQTDCFMANGHLTECSRSGQDQANQTGAAWSIPRFIDNQDGTLEDKLTGLTWMRSGRMAQTPVTHQEALDLVADLNVHPNAHGQGGYYKNFTDWRLPNRQELSSLIDFGKHNPAVAAPERFVGLVNDRYWSSTTHTAGPDSAWTVSFANGSTSAEAKQNTGFVMPVRGGNTGAPDQAVIFSAPESCDFGYTPAGQTSHEKNIRIYNLGSTELSMGKISLGGENYEDFMLVSDACSNMKLFPEGECRISLVFKPPSEGIKTAEINIPSNDPDHPVWMIPTRGTTLVSFPARTSQTGQTSCHDASGYNTGCGKSGQNGEAQSGAAWPDPRFADHENGTITDTLTGLMWLKSADLTDQTLNWQQAVDLARDLNEIPGSNGRGGYITTYRDWRLPNRKELASLVDHSRHNPALPESHRFTHVRNNAYWSSDTIPSGQKNPNDTAWTVSLADGSMSGTGKYQEYYFLAVRAGFQDNIAHPRARISPALYQFPLTPAGASL